MEILYTCPKCDAYGYVLTAGTKNLFGYALDKQILCSLCKGHKEVSDETIKQYKKSSDCQNEK